MIGIICHDSVTTVGHSLFMNFHIALKNYFKESFTPVSCIDNLNSIKLLIIVDEHYAPHNQIWQNIEFINAINSNNIKVLIFNFEKIFNSQFPWNIEIQNFVDKINKKIQLVSDIEDAAILNTPIINKQLLSKDTFLAEPVQHKDDVILFIGQVNEYYPTRNNILNELQQINSKVKVVKTDRKYSYIEFISAMNRAKYILNPLGTGKFINLRFYEALSLDCIVVQQYTDDMLDMYSELNSPNVLKFKDADEFKSINFIDNIPCNKAYLENYFEEINLLDKIKNI